MPNRSPNQSPDSLNRSPANSLNIFRPVTNFGADEAQEFKKRLAPDERELWELKLVRNLLRPTRHPKAEIISAPEFRRALRKADIAAVSQDYIEELAAHVEGTLDGAEASHEVATMPLRVGHNRSGTYLTVAPSRRIFRERKAAQQAIARYFGYEEMPGNPWSSQASASEVWLARSYQDTEAAYIHRLEDMLNEEPSLLPEVTVFGPVEFKPFIPNIREPK
jgi:hypothetical protein